MYSVLQFVGKCLFEVAINCSSTIFLFKNKIEIKWNTFKLINNKCVWLWNSLALHNIRLHFRIISFYYILLIPALRNHVRPLRDWLHSGEICSCIFYSLIYCVFSRTDTFRVIWRLPAFTGGEDPTHTITGISAYMGRTTDALQVTWKTSPHESYTAL